MMYELVCKWRRVVEDPHCIEIECDGAYVDGDLLDVYGARYCPYCGKRIAEVSVFVEGGKNND